MVLVERKVWGLGTTAPNVSMLKKPWFQDKHWGASAHWIWPGLLSKYFIHLLTPQPHFQVFRLRV